MSNALRFIDLFCGIGGFHVALDQACSESGIDAQCVFSCDIDEECQKAYAANFGEKPEGDITDLPEENIPDHDLLLAGFPCQPFSIIGKRKGFEDIRGTLFFDIARILREKQPPAFILENVKLLVGHNKGKTFARILETLRELGYHVSHRVLNALNFGLPQKRERTFIVGFREACHFEWPPGDISMKPLADILERNIPKKYYASEMIRKKRLKKCKPTKEPTIWHENKSGHISAHPFSCALRAGASYNYLLVNGKRRLTSREMLRLQGFPDSFEIVCNDYQTRKQAGNSLPVPVARDIIKNVIEACGWSPLFSYEPSEYLSIDRQFNLLENNHGYRQNAKTKNRRKVQVSLPAQSVSA